MKKIVNYYAKYLEKKYCISDYFSGFVAEELINDYKKYNIFEVIRAHRNGFSVVLWKNLNKEDKKNIKNILSPLKYLSLHPINKEYSYIIDDKLTLKKLCAGSAVDKYMPKYYLKIDSNKNISFLWNYKGKTDSKGVIELIKHEKDLAVKRIAGSLGEGFYRLSYINDCFYLNDDCYIEEKLLEKLLSLENYIITEYFRPHKDLAKIYQNAANTIRYQVGVIENEPYVLKTEIGFGTNKSNNIENVNGIYCPVNEDGYFNGGVIETENGLVDIFYHTDSNMKLQGRIPLWQEFEKMTKAFIKQFPKLKYLGFDIVITSNNELKILETNSLSLYNTFNVIRLDDSYLGKFFKEILKNGN